MTRLPKVLCSGRTCPPGSSLLNRSSTRTTRSRAFPHNPKSLDQLPELHRVLVVPRLGQLEPRHPSQPELPSHRNKATFGSRKAAAYWGGRFSFRESPTPLDFELFLHSEK